MWKTLSEVRIPDIQQFVRDASRDGQAVHVGTDSLQSGRFTQFVTVVVILTPRKGGRVAYRREVVARISSLRERLLKEVWESVDLGLQFSPLVKGELTVHIDANPVVAHKSSAYVQELVGLVVGQGFKALIKPDSWAASHAADHVVRTQGKLVGWPSGGALVRNTGSRGSTPRPASTAASCVGFSGLMVAIELTSPGRRCASPHSVIGGVHSAHGF